MQIWPNGEMNIVAQRENLNLAERGNRNLAERGNGNLAERGNENLAERGNENLAGRGNGNLVVRNEGDGLSSESEFGRDGLSSESGPSRPLGAYFWAARLSIYIVFEGKRLLSIFRWYG